MNKIAIVSPMLLPVSDINGGAVEQLILNIINQNEKSSSPIMIDLYTMYSDNVNLDYKYTDVIFVRKNLLFKYVQKFKNLFYKIFRFDYRYDYILSSTIREIKKRKYDRVIVENRMGLYKKIYQETDNKHNLIYHMHNDFDTGDKTIDNYLFIESSCLKILTVSDYIKNRLNSVKKSDKIFTFHNCIDLGKFSLDPDDKIKRYDLMKEIGFSKNNFIIGFVGRVTEEKGILDLVIAFKNFVKVYHNAKLLVVGSSWFDASKKTKFENMLIEETSSIKSNVFFTGYIDYSKIKFYYDLMDVIVIPSKCNEAFGLVALESLAMGLNVISTRSGALEEVLGENAQFVSVEKLSLDIYNSLQQLYSSNYKNRKCYDVSGYSIENYYNDFLCLIK